MITAWKIPRWRWAFLIAVASDALGFLLVLLPPAEWLLDAVTAAALLAVLGFRWPLFVALAVEVIPALQLFPTWTLVVLAMSATTSQGSPKGTSDSGISAETSGVHASPSEVRQGEGTDGGQPPPPLLLNPPRPEVKSIETKLPPGLPESKNQAHGA